MSHSLTTNFGQSDLYATTVADNPLVLDLLVLSARALPVTGGAKNLLAKEAALFWFKCSIVNCFRFFDLASRPLITDDI